MSLIVGSSTGIINDISIQQSVSRGGCLNDCPMDDVLVGDYVTNVFLDDNILRSKCGCSNYGGDHRNVSAQTITELTVPRAFTSINVS